MNEATQIPAREHSPKSGFVQGRDTQPSSMPFAGAGLSANATERNRTLVNVERVPKSGRGPKTERFQKRAANVTSGSRVFHERYRSVALCFSGVTWGGMTVTELAVVTGSAAVTDSVTLERGVPPQLLHAPSRFVHAWCTDRAYLNEGACEHLRSPSGRFGRPMTNPLPNPSA